jgi:hypothetical protein
MKSVALPSVLVLALLGAGMGCIAETDPGEDIDPIEVELQPQPVEPPEADAGTTQVMLCPIEVPCGRPCTPPQIVLEGPCIPMNQ